MTVFKLARKLTFGRFIDWLQGRAALFPAPSNKRKGAARMAPKSLRAYQFAMVESEQRKKRTRLARRKKRLGFVVVFALLALPRCTYTARKPVKPVTPLVIPQSCIDAIYIMKPDAQCSDVRDGRLRCKDFEVTFHCEKVKSRC